MRKLLIKFSICLIVVTISALIGKAQTSVGYVLEIRGGWYLNGNTSNTLRQGQKLPPSSVIRIQSPNSYDFITIADMNGKIRDSRNCSANCTTPIRLPAAPTQPTVAGKILQAAMDWIFGSPDRYSANRNRSDEISDGVVKITDGKIDIGSLLNIQGQYYLRWRAVTDEKAEPCAWSEMFELSSIISFADSKPGLYEFSVLRKHETSFEQISSAWILVSSAEDYEKTKQSYQQAVELTKEWEGKVKSATVQSFLKAHLDELARKNMK